jgi:hypothetical protein
MDKNQLVTIAVTALISTTAKELLTWAFGRAKRIATTETTKQKARKIFSKTNLRIMLEASAFSLSLYALWWDTFYDPRPITKWLIVKLTFFTLGTLGWFTFFLSDVMLAILEYRERRKQLAMKNSN